MSTRSCHQDGAIAGIETLFRAHGLNVEAIEELAHGIAARTFVVRSRDGRTFAVRYDRRRSLQRVREDRIFSELAGSCGLAVPCGPWLEGSLDDAAIVARPFLEGTTLSEVPAGTWPSGRRVGSMLAMLHGLRPPIARRPFFYRSALESRHQLCASYAANLCPMADTREDAALLSEAIARLRTMSEDHRRLETSPQGVVHGDFTPGNLLVRGSDLYLIDWEKACVGPICSDLAQAMYYFFPAVAGEAPVFLKDFVETYRERRPIEIAPCRAWLTLHPAMIFLHDAASTFACRFGREPDREKKRELYFRNHSIPRYKSFLDAEDVMLDLISARR